jgi:hypothetical protein
VTAAALAACAALLCADTGKLALMPLPKQALGPDAASLSLTRDSGVDSNASAARNAGGGLARQGRVTGYILDYGATGARRRTLLGVETIAELYRSDASATRGLAFWLGVTRRLDGAHQNGVAISLAPFAASVGDGAFAFELTYKLGGRPVGYVDDVVFRTGSVLGAVFVTATKEAGLRTRTIGLVEKLLARIRGVEAGRIR